MGLVYGSVLWAWSTGVCCAPVRLWRALSRRSPSPRCPPTPRHPAPVTGPATAAAATAAVALLPLEGLGRRLRQNAHDWPSESRLKCGAKSFSKGAARSSFRPPVFGDGFGSRSWARTEIWPPFWASQAWASASRPNGGESTGCRRRVATDVPLPGAHTHTHTHAPASAHGTSTRPSSDSSGFGGE